MRCEWRDFVSGAAVFGAISALFILTVPTPSIGNNGAGGVEKKSSKFQLSKESQAAMVQIRQIVTDNHSLVTHRRMPVVRAQKIAKQVIDLLRAIRKVDVDGAKNTGQAALEKILNNLELGIRAVARADKTLNPIDGIVLMDEALAKYARNFDHPGWKGVREL